MLRCELDVMEYAVTMETVELEAMTNNEEIITKDIKIRDEYSDFGIVEVIYLNHERYIVDDHFYPCDNVQCYIATRYYNDYSVKETIYLTKNDDDDFYYCTIETYEL